MSLSKPVFRHELKYLISYPEAALIRSRIAPIMQVDKHTGEAKEYSIRSLYFDDYFDSAYKEKEAGIYARKKYRIRIYNYSDSFIHLERKTKNDQYIYKQSVSLTRKDTDRIMEGDYRFLEHSENPFLQEVYFELSARLLRPRVIVDYEREPYVYTDGNVRVTFDKHVRGSGSFDLFDPLLPVKETMDSDLLIMEVKYDHFLPEFIRKAVVPKSMVYTAVSKFVLCCDVCPKATDHFGWKACLPGTVPLSVERGYPGQYRIDT